MHVCSLSHCIAMQWLNNKLKENYYTYLYHKYKEFALQIEWNLGKPIHEVDEFIIKKYN